MIQHDIGNDAIASGLLFQVFCRCGGYAHIKLGDNTFQSCFRKAFDGVVKFHAVNFVDGEVTLQAHAVDGNAVLFQADCKVIEGLRFCLAL